MLPTFALRLSVVLLLGLLISVHLPAAAADEDPIATDRPDFVESSQVVGRGRFQVETSVLAERDRHDGVRSRTYSTPTLLRFGVSDTLEVRLETDGRINEHTTLMRDGSRNAASGYADPSIGVKWHLLDDAPGMPAVAVLLHADLARGSSDFQGQGVRPSLRAVAEWDLPVGLALGVMPGVGLERTDAGARYRYGILGVVLGKELTPTVRAFVELAAPRIARASDGGTVASFDAGAAWLLSERCQLDTMLAAGLNRRTPNLALTLGFSFKM